MEESFAEAVERGAPLDVVQREDLTVRRGYETRQPAGIGSMYRFRATVRVVGIVGNPSVRCCLSRGSIAVHCCAE